MKTILKTICLITAGILLLAVGGCATVRLETKVDPSANPGEWKTYRWMPDAGKHNTDPRINTKFLDSVVRKCVNEELTGKGLKMVKDGPVDFQVTYHAAMKTKVEERLLDDRYSSRPAWSRKDTLMLSGPSPEEVVHDEGSLIIDFVDPKGKQPLWRSSFQTKIHSYADEAKREQAIRKAVTRMLGNFPG